MAWIASRRNGILCGLAAFGLWGVMPLYFVAIRHVPPLEMLGSTNCLERFAPGRDAFGHRSVGTGRPLSVVAENRSDVPRLRGFLVGKLADLHLRRSTQQTVETSLGYFINPLLNVAWE